MLNTNVLSKNSNKKKCQNLNEICQHYRNFYKGRLKGSGVSRFGEKFFSVQITQKVNFWANLASERNIYLFWTLLRSFLYFLYQFGRESPVIQFWSDEEQKGRQISAI